ncbi:MAG: EFR1 family ferrodoxin, partial [bacterium]
NYTPLYGAPAEKKQKELFSKAEIKLNRIAEIVREGRTARIESGFFLTNVIFSSFIYQNSISRFSQMDSDFRVSEKCNGCGVCARVCPVDNIEMEGTRPKWRHHCEQCLACLHWCPEEAIEMGKRTQGRKRYRHPEITMDEIIQQK